MDAAAWKEFWEEFEDKCDGLDQQYQKDMLKKHGESGHYFMSDEAYWDLQKQLIQKLIMKRMSK